MKQREFEMLIWASSFSGAARRRNNSQKDCAEAGDRDVTFFREYLQSWDAKDSFPVKELWLEDEDDDDEVY